jgi:uncharacterized membrane protein
MNVMKWGCIGFLMVLFAFSASATYISLSTTVDADRLVNTTSTRVNITMTNNGDEPAYDVVVEPMFDAGFTAEQLALGNVNPNQTVSGSIDLNISQDAAPGRYSMGFLIRYADVNNYPFTFVSPLKLSYLTMVQSNVVGLLNEVVLEGDAKSTMTLTVQNRDDKQHEVTVKLYTPNQIAVDGQERKITLAPKSESKVDFTVSSLGALPGGDFFVFAVLNYNEDSRHYSVMSSNGRITTAKAQSVMGVLAPFIIIIVVVLFIALIYLQLRKDKPVSPGKKPAASKKAGSKEED